MAEYVILVDSNDRQVGTEEKVKCHLPDGKLHRAFTALLFDDQGMLALARRSSSKMLWPGDWDGTFASHPREGETYTSSGERRMPEELGLQCRLDYLFKFEYHAPYKDVGSENEICGTLMGVMDRQAAFAPAEGEISEMRWACADGLAAALREDPTGYCPWMIIALYLLDESAPEAMARHRDVLEPWTEPEIRGQMRRAIAAHIPESQWGLVADE